MAVLCIVQDSHFVVIEINFVDEGINQCLSIFGIIDISFAVLSCAVQEKFVIAPKSHYIEPLNLYFLIIANSGERKSAIVRLMTQPIYQYEHKENERRCLQMESDQIKLSSMKKQIETLERDGNTEEAAKVRYQYRSLEQHQTKSLRLIAVDITPEASLPFSFRSMKLPIRKDENVYPESRPQIR